MEKFEITSEKGETVDSTKFNPIQIELNQTKNDLNFEVKESKMIFSINDKSQFPSINYIREMSFQEIKGLNKVFTLLDSFNDFYEYLKTLSENKKLNLKKINDKITIIFSVEVLSKQQEIEIDLFPSRKDINANIIKYKRRNRFSKKAK